MLSSPTQPGVVLGTVEVHGARASAWTAGGSARGSVRIWSDPLRVAVGPPRVFSRNAAGGDGGDPERRSARAQRRSRGDSSGLGPHRRSLPREESVGTISNGQRPCIRSGEPIGRVERVSLDRHACRLSADLQAVAGLGRRRVDTGYPGALRVPSTSASGEATSSPIRFQIPPTVEFGGPGNFGLSPDGRQLAFVGRGPDGVMRLWIRTMDSLEVRSLPGSEANENTPPPFWSPDGRFVAFDAGGKLKKLDVSGGPPQTLCDLPSVAVGGTWNRNGDIIVGNITGGLLHVRETGGAASPVTTLDPSRKEEFHMLPSFLPDGRHFVYLRVAPGGPEFSGTYVGMLDAKPDEQSKERLLPYQVGLTYAAATDSGPGRLLFLSRGDAHGAAVR